jgi:tetratricopeptide (TPR) repeat protein
VSKARKTGDIHGHKKQVFIIALGLFILSCILYGNTLQNGYNIDDALVTKNHPLTSQGISAIPKIFQSPYYFDEAGYAFDYRPVVSSSFALEHGIFGESPTTSHGINVCLYGLTGVLLFFLLRLLMRKDDPNKVWFPALISLLFLVHPLHTEVVNSIKSRDELLALFFGLLATYLFVYGKGRRATWAWYALGTGVFTMGLMSKLSVLSFAVLIPMSLVLFRKVGWKAVVATSLPLTVVSLALLPPLSTTMLIQIGLGFLLLPLVILLLQKAPKLQSKLSFGNQDFPYSTLQLLSLILLLSSAAWSIAAPLSPFSILALWIAIGLSLLAFAHSKFIDWILIGAYVLIAVATMPYLNHKLLTVGSLYGLFFLFGTREHSLGGKWWVHALWVALVGAYLVITGSPATLVLLIVTAALLWLGRSKKVPKAAIISIVASFGLAGYMGFEQSYQAMSTFLSLGLFVAALQQPALSKRANPVAFGLITLIGIMVLLLLQQTAPAAPSNQSETAAVEQQVPEEDRSKRVLEFSENPIPYQAPHKRLPTALNISKQYLQLMVWPAPLRFYYGYNMVPILEWSSPKAWIGLLLLLGLGLLAVSAIFWDDWVAWGSILLLLSLGQFSNYLIPLPGIIGERFMYIGSLGFVVLIVQLIYLALQKWQLTSSRGVKRIAILLGLGFLAVTAFYVIQRNRHWKDTLTLYRHDIAHLSKSAKAHQLLAAELLKESEKIRDINQQNTTLTEAATHFKACVAIYPDFPYAYFDLGTTQMKLGQYEEAQRSTEKSLEVDLYNPQAKFQLALIHELKEESPLAVEDYRATIADEPNMLEAYLNLSTLLFRIGDYEEGLQVSYRALEKWPEYPQLLVNIGNALAQNSAFSEAAIYFARALQQSPGERALIEKIVYCYQQISRPDLAQPYLNQLQ